MIIKTHKKIFVLLTMAILFPAVISARSLPRQIYVPSHLMGTGASSLFGFFFDPVFQEEDPFYKKLFEDGKYFYQNDNIAEAIENFEIAFFGYLDNLPRLLECYIYLTVCHFQKKNVEKSKYYADEIRRLKLQDYLNKINPPGNLIKKYDEIIAKIYKS